MTRVLKYVGAGIGVLLIALVVFVLWGSSGRLSPDERARVKTYAGAPTAEAADTITVMTYNIGYLSGMTNNRPVERSKRLFLDNMQQALDLVRTAAPDVVALQEIDYGGARVAHIHQLDTLATRLEFPVAAQAVNWDKRYVPFPYGLPAVHFGRILSGQSVLSRVPLRDHVRRVLPRPPQVFVRDIFYLDRLAQGVLLDLGGRAWVVLNLHLEAFDEDTREKQAVIVARLYERLNRANLPVLVVGDFNSTMARIADSIAASPPDSTDGDETMRTLLGDTDLRPVYPNPDEAPPTYPADSPTRKIDYILYDSTEAQPIGRSVQCASPSPPSDHCAVVARLRLRNPAITAPPIDQVPPLDSILAE